MMTTCVRVELNQANPHVRDKYSLLSDPNSEALMKAMMVTIIDRERKRKLWEKASYSESVNKIMLGMFLDIKEIAIGEDINKLFEDGMRVITLSTHRDKVISIYGAISSAISNVLRIEREACVGSVPLEIDTDLFKQCRELDEALFYLINIDLGLSEVDSVLCFVLMRLFIKKSSFNQATGIAYCMASHGHQEGMVELANLLQAARAIEPEKAIELYESVSDKENPRYQEAQLALAGLYGSLSNPNDGSDASVSLIPALRAASRAGEENQMLFDRLFHQLAGGEGLTQSGVTPDVEGLIKVASTVRALRQENKALKDERAEDKVKMNALAKELERTKQALAVATKDTSTKEKDGAKPALFRRSGRASSC